MNKNEIIENIEKSVPVEWDLLPDIDLYMDQVLFYLKRNQIEGTEEVDLTSAMVNNYVKEGLLPRANGKRYSREHLVRLKIIACLKQIFSVKDMKELISEIPEDNTTEEIHETFRALVIDSIERADKMLGEKDQENLALRFAIHSYVFKNISEMIFKGASIR